MSGGGGKQGEEIGGEMSTRAFLIPVALLFGMSLFGAGRAAAADPGEWEVGNWSGDLHPTTVGCKAMYANTKDDYSFILWVYNQGSRIRDSSLVYIYFTNDGDDIDEDRGFSGFLSEKSSVTFSMGNGFRKQANLAQVLISSFEFGLPRAAIDAFPPGGLFTIQLPNGKHYTIKLPPSQAAIANFKKCFGG
jgi:hypothetical protein